MTLVESLPTFTGSATAEEFRAEYRALPCVVFKLARNAVSSRHIKSNHGPSGIKRKRSDSNLDSSSQHPPSPRDLHGLAFVQTILDTFLSSTAKDQESWCIENTDVLDASSTLASDFLSPKSTQNGYCSFVLQDNSAEAVSKFTEEHVEFPTLPLTSDTKINEKVNGGCDAPDDNSIHAAKENGQGDDLSKNANTTIAVSTEDKNRNNNSSNNDDDDDKTKSGEDPNNIFISDPYWLFVGRNTSTTPMMGRTEHTDGILHDGTFHFQVVGQKTWKLRPTTELRTMCDEHYDLALKDSYVVTVEEGDIFVINTRLWWHQTELPGVPAEPVTSEGSEAANTGKKSKPNSPSGLSISYARDMYFDGRQPEEGESEYMSSMDGAWATGNIPQGTVLFTEKDPPIRKSKDKNKTNCEMFEVDDEEGGTQLAVVTSKDITEGDFFVIYDKNADEGDPDSRGASSEGEY